MAEQDLKDNQGRLDSPVKLVNAVNKDPVDQTDSPEAQVFTSIHKATERSDLCSCNRKKN